MFSWRTFNIAWELRFSFFLVLAILSWQDAKNGALLGLYAALLHESGHLIMMTFLHIPIKKVVFYAAGIRIETPGHIISALHEAIILSGGCVWNFACFIIIYALGFFIQISEAMQFFAMANLSLGIFNLLPFKKFDGGRLLTLFFEYVLPPSSHRAGHITRRLIAILLIATCLILFPIVSNPSLVLTVVYFLIAEFLG